METTVNDRIRKQPKYWALATAAILVTAFVLVQPMQAIQADVSTSVSPGEFEDCTVRSNELTDGDTPKGIYGDAPDDGIAMNTVKNRDVAKTIHAEKQIYDCFIIQGNLAIIVDVTIIAEIFQNLTTKEIEKTTAEVITCIKIEGSADLVNCYTTIPTGAVVLTGCDEDVLDHPLEMNTVNKGATVKTIKAEKEVFFCDFEPNIGSNVEPDDSPYLKKVDLVIFTDIWENLNTQNVIKKEVFSFRCVAIINTADVEACDYSLPDDITTPV